MLRRMPSAQGDGGVLGEGVAEFVAELKGHLCPVVALGVQADADASAPVVHKVRHRKIAARIDAQRLEAFTGTVRPDFGRCGLHHGADVGSGSVPPAATVDDDLELARIRLRTGENRGDDASRGEAG